MEIRTTYYLHDQDGKPVELNRSEGEKDLGVVVDDKINFDKHIQQQVNKANSIIGNGTNKQNIHVAVSNQL